VKTIAEFYSGVFQYFNLSSPTEIIKCYSSLDAIAFFTGIYGANKILFDLENREFAALHFDALKQIILSIFLEHRVSKCILKTQEWIDLVTAVGIADWDEKYYVAAGRLYDQAHFLLLGQQFRPVIANMVSQNFEESGKAYAVVMEKFAELVKGEGFGYLYIAGFSNGFAITTNVSYPNDSLALWNHTTGGIAMKFLYELATAVTDGKWKDSFENTVKFWREKGEDIIGQIPVDVWVGLQQSNDNKELTEVLGVDILSREFEDLASAYIQKHPFRYYATLKVIKKSLKKLRMMQAGAVYGALVKAIATEDYSDY